MEKEFSGIAIIVLSKCDLQFYFCGNMHCLSSFHCPLKDAMIAMLMTFFFHFPEYCEKYAKQEDVGAAAEEKSSDEELSEDEYAASDDEEIAGKPDP